MQAELDRLDDELRRRFQRLFRRCQKIEKLRYYKQRRERLLEALAFQAQSVPSYSGAADGQRVVEKLQRGRRSVDRLDERLRQREEIYERLRIRFLQRKRQRAELRDQLLSLSPSRAANSENESEPDYPF